MNYIDYILLGVIAFFAIKGLIRGFINEAFSLVGLLVSLLLATRLMSDAARWLKQFIDIPPALSTILGFLLVFVAVQLAILVLNHVLQKIVKLAFMGWIDKLAGSCIGFLKGATVASLLTILLTLIPMSNELLPAQKESKLIGPTRGFAPYVFNFLSEIVPNSKSFYAEMKESLGNFSSSKIAEQTQDFLQSVRLPEEDSPSEKDE